MISFLKWFVAIPIWLAFVAIYGILLSPFWLIVAMTATWISSHSWAEPKERYFRWGDFWRLWRDLVLCRWRM